MEQKITTHIVKGILISLMLIVLDLVSQFADFKFEQWFGWTSFAITIGLLIWATVTYGKEMNNNVTFGNLFAHGFKTTAVVTCIVFVYTILSVYIIFPNYIDQLIQKGMEEAAKSGQQMPETTGEGMEMAKKITTLIVLAGVVLGELVIGSIGALIGAAIAKKNPKDPFAQPLT